MTINDALAPLNGPVLGVVIILLAVMLAVILARVWLRLWKGSSTLSSALPRHADRLLSHNTEFNRAEPLAIAPQRPAPTPPPPPQPTSTATGHVSKAVATLNARLVLRPGASQAERSFLDFLRNTVGEQYVIQTKIPLRDIIARYGWLEKGLYTMHQHGHIDFLICDQRLNPRLAVELDDRTHQRPDRVDADRRKEELLANARLQLIRIRVGDRWGEKEREAILSALSGTKTG